MLDIFFKISVIVCATFFLIKLLTQIIFWISLNILISQIKKQAKNLNSSSQQLINSLENIAEDVASVTSLINIKKTQQKAQKRKIKLIRQRLNAQKKDDEFWK